MTDFTYEILPNQSMKLTVSRRTIQRYMTSSDEFAATRALARGAHLFLVRP
jgi:hypothetical protein